MKSGAMPPLTSARPRFKSWATEFAEIGREAGPDTSISETSAITRGPNGSSCSMGGFTTPGTACGVGPGIGCVGCKIARALSDTPKRAVVREVPGAIFEISGIFDMDRSEGGKSILDEDAPGRDAFIEVEVPGAWLRLKWETSKEPVVELAFEPGACGGPGG